MSQTKAQLVGGVGLSTANSLTVHNGLAVTGVVTATSFSGNGAGLIGLANTAFINAEQVTVIGLVTATTFDGDVVGNITGVAATFTGNVTVGGTLTYDDVTNVDSIGVVTARSGIQFGLAGVGGSVSGTGNANFVGIVTATSLDASIAFWTLGASGTDHYTFTGPGDLSGDTDPDLQLIRGQKYIFKNRSGGHPFRIQSTPNGSAGTEYNDGVTNNDAGNGTDLIFDVPFDAPSILYYQCTSHGNMGGPIYVGSSSGDDVNVGAAVTIYASTGIVSATSYYGDGSTLSGIDASPSFSGIASGSLTNGQTVIVTTDGKLMAITGNAASDALHSVQAYTTGSVKQQAITYDTNSNKVVVFYRDDDNGERGTARVGTVAADGTITYGSAVVFAQDPVYLSACFDTNSNKVVVAYYDEVTGQGKAVVGTVSGTSISFGSETAYKTDGLNYIDCVFDSNSNKVVIVWANTSNSNVGESVVATVSGSSISFGSIETFSSNNVSYSRLAFDSNSNKVVVGYNNNTDTAGVARVGTVSGTSISWGSESTWEGQTTEDNDITFDSTNNKIVVTAKWSSNGYAIAAVGTVSGTSISFGSGVNIQETNYTSRNQCVYDSNANRVVFFYRKSNASSHVHIKYGQVSGTTITNLSSEFDTNNASTYHTFGVFDPDQNKVIFTYRNGSDSNKGVLQAVQIGYNNSNLTATNFIGISNAAYSNGDTATVQIPGAVDDAQSGLVGGNIYYVQPNGTLATTVGGATTVVAGRAVSATKLLISFA